MAAVPYQVSSDGIECSGKDWSSNDGNVQVTWREMTVVVNPAKKNERSKTFIK
jgi:hypothetical protein